MKRLLIYLVCAGFMFSLSGQVHAVEKHKKSKTKVVKKQEASSTLKKAPPAGREKARGKKFDRFVDSNNNGIDDRRENLKQKSAPKQTTAQKTTKKSAQKKSETDQKSKK
ncbi:MAG: hypothetical protein OEW00_05095 [candidate division Zixibacteria bacterium]|nr:hypothetical protein [candidate division Zixibacteria bacterium]